MSSRRIGIAACTWGLEPSFALVPDRDPNEVLRTVSRLGFEGVEPATLNGEGAAVRRVLDDEALVCPARFVGLSLEDPEASLSTGLAAIDDLLALGGEVLLIGIEEVGDLGVLEDLVGACVRASISPALHPEIGGPVAGAQSVDVLLDRIAHLDVCLDTGHFWAAGENDLGALVRGWSERLAHVHLKDVRGSVAESLRRGHLDLGEAVREGLWQPLGQGDVPLVEFLEELDLLGYEGWLVIEHDFAPDPEESARASLAWLDARPLQVSA